MLSRKEVEERLRQSAPIGADSPNNEYSALETAAQLAEWLVWALEDCDTCSQFDDTRPSGDKCLLVKGKHSCDDRAARAWLEGR